MSFLHGTVVGQDVRMTTVKMGVNKALSDRMPEAIKASLSNMTTVASTLAVQGAHLHNFLITSQVANENELTYDMIVGEQYLYAVYNDNTFLRGVPLGEVGSEIPTHHR